MNWISVKDKMPPSGEELIVVVSTRDLEEDGSSESFFIRCATYSSYWMEEEERKTYQSKAWTVHGERVTYSDIIGRTITLKGKATMTVETIETE